MIILPLKAAAPSKTPLKNPFHSAGKRAKFSVLFYVQLNNGWLLKNLSLANTLPNYYHLRGGGSVVAGSVKQKIMWMSTLYVAESFWPFGKILHKTLVPWCYCGPHTIAITLSGEDGY